MYVWISFLDVYVKCLYWGY